MKPAIRIGTSGWTYDAHAIGNARTFRELLAG